MTRRSSVRAQAREIYRQMVAARARHEDSPSLTLPRMRGREGDEQAGREQKEEEGEKSLTAQNLTEKVRALYEHSAVPVAEIAALAGVTERTIYKYAAKERWTQRYAFTRRGAGAADGSRPRGQRVAKRFAPDFVPVRGAGGRFIRRADKGKAFATGLKATDPAAAAACRRAAALARRAQVKAEAERRDQASLRALETVNRAMADLNRYRAARAKAGQPTLRDDDRVAQLLVRMVEITTERWQCLLTGAAQSQNRKSARARPD